jgi:hypothetical protein
MKKQPKLMPVDDVEVPVALTVRERQFLLSLVMKLPFQITLEGLADNKTLADLTALAKKLDVQDEEIQEAVKPVLNSSGANDTIIAEEG